MRVNIDDDLHSDFRFRRLVRAIGDEDKAVGMVYRFWKLAQKYWIHDCGLIPVEEFEAEGLEPILKAGLAQMRVGGIYARGSEERFAWYFQRKAAGKVRAKAQRNPDGTFAAPPEPSEEPSADGQEASATPPIVQPLALALAPSLAPSPALAQKKEKEKSFSQGVTADEVRECAEAWRETLRFYKAGRNLAPWEETQIARAIQHYGKGFVKAALEGVRYEGKGEGYNPANYLNLARVFDPTKIQSFVNLGAQALHKRQEEGTA